MKVFNPRLLTNLKATSATAQKVCFSASSLSWKQSEESPIEKSNEVKGRQQAFIEAEEQLYDRKLFMAVQENSRLTTEAKMKLQGVDAEADAAEHQYLLSQLSTLELESERLSMLFGESQITQHFQDLEYKLKEQIDIQHLRNSKYWAFIGAIAGCIVGGIVGSLRSSQKMDDNFKDLKMAVADQAATGKMEQISALLKTLMESSVSSSENLKDSLTGLQSILMKKLLDDHDNRGSVTGLSPEVIKAYKGSPTFEHLESIKEEMEQVRSLISVIDERTTEMFSSFVSQKSQTAQLLNTVEHVVNTNQQRSVDHLETKLLLDGIGRRLDEAAEHMYAVEAKLPAPVEVVEEPEPLPELPPPQETCVEPPVESVKTVKKSGGFRSQSAGICFLLGSILYCLYNN